jgi:hypothetical protein
MRRACVVALVLAASVAPAHGYEFWLRSHTIGQAYQLREYRLVGPDLFHGRRRYSQTLALRIWDIGDFAKQRRVSRLPDRGVRVGWQSYLRVDHDFGSFSNGRVTVGNVRRDALDAFPELGETLISLELMYGYFEVSGIGDDRVTLRIGRLLAEDGWGTSAIDGMSARVELPQPAAIVAQAGFRVRASSPLGISEYELDGTAGAACREYAEGVTPGTGTWKLIDRSRAIENSRFASDFEFCPQRDQLQPSIAVGVTTSRMRQFGAELGYRRTWSSTVGLIGEVDRLDNPDQGLYPNEFGQAPKRGVNEEYVYARAHHEVTGGGVTVRPLVEVRASLLHAAIDRARLAATVKRGAHELEPSVERFLPTFDGDSIFNVFSIEAASDARLEYRYDGPVRANARGWLRRYEDTDAYAGGFEGGVERALSRTTRARADALWDDGYGGRRIGGGGQVAWQPVTRMWLRGRAIVLGVAPDDRTKYVTTAGVVSTTYKLGDFAAIHAIAELDHDAIHDTQFRAIGVLDLAFAPEP